MAGRLSKTGAGKPIWQMPRTVTLVSPVRTIWETTMTRARNFRLKIRTVTQLTILPQLTHAHRTVHSTLPLIRIRICWTWLRTCVRHSDVRQPSDLAQRKRIGPITQGSVDRNYQSLDETYFLLNNNSPGHFCTPLLPRWLLSCIAAVFSFTPFSVEGIVRDLYENSHPGLWGVFILCHVWYTFPSPPSRYIR